MNDKRIISTVYLFQNGMVMVFDQFGEQMPDYQGKYLEVRDNVRRDAPKNTQFYLGRWRESQTAYPIEYF